MLTLLTKEEDHLIKVQSLFFFATSLAGVFLQIFVFKIAGFREFILFNFSALVGLFVIYISSGYILKNDSTRTLIRGGLVVFIGFWLSLLLLREEARHYIELLGFIIGAANGFYWSGLNLSQYIIAHSEKRALFFGKIDTFTNMMKAVAPIAAGFLIKSGNELFHSDTAGYYVLFALVFFIKIYIVYEAGHIPRHSGVKFSLKNIFPQKPPRIWTFATIHQFITGLSDATFSALGGILIFTVLNNEFHVGVQMMSAGLILAVSSFVAGKLYRTNQSIHIYGAILFAASMILLGLFQNIYTVILFTCLYAIGTPLMNIAGSLLVYRGFDSIKGSWQEKYEVFIQRDSVLGIARMISFGILYFMFEYFAKTEAAQKWFIYFSFTPLLISFILKKAQKEIKTT